jgi:hypothetical protein
METDRGRNALTDFTAQQIVELVLQALKEAARDVDERRVPLDGRVRHLQKTAVAPVSDAAE